ncbi:hypothetical protein F5Y15DRAFT_409212 [Xylariaceae sp. FL0016]|nr:hypothetical protein F5Y15DRAFT_409212 [Xylariaceae sp. FL0016]
MTAAQPRRAPLGDATERLINASPQKPNKRRQHRHEPEPVEPNPLRAHPTKVQHAPPAQSRSASRAGSSVSKPNPNGSRAPSNHCLSTISQGERNESKRSSQVSTSSAATTASGGKRKTHIGPWELGKTLGKGSAGRVRLARHRTSRDLVAVKILARNTAVMTQSGSLAELDKWDRTRAEFVSERQMPLSIEREVALLKLIDHPNIVKLYDIWENRAEIYLVMEYMDMGDMFTYINQNGRLEEWETMVYFRQILSALEYVHSFNICHRDLKPENILMQQGGVVKIADFGMAALQQGPNHSLRTSCGSPHYAAPELIYKGPYRGDRVDIWSLGIILYACLCAQLPFDDPQGDVTRLLGRAATGEYYTPSYLSRESGDLIARMLTVDPRKRITISKIWKHVLVQKYADMDHQHDRDWSAQAELLKLGQREPILLENIDTQTLRQLKAMYHTFSEKHLAMQLMAPEPNDQKLFYWLLYNYREKRLENYGTELTHSASDYHHLQPPNWKKKYTTAEFPSKYGRTPSRFTVISNVPTEGSDDNLDAVTDGGTTVKSYDPYKSSIVLNGGVASHANIIVHRNTSSARTSTHTSSRRGKRSASCKSSSTFAKPNKGGRQIMAPAALRASRRSLSSIRSNESVSYVRPASRHKRGVDFSHIRKRPMSPGSPASIAGDDATYDRERTSPNTSTKWIRPSKRTGGRANSSIQTMADVSQVAEKGLAWNEEMREFTHSIAKDCDAAFNSSILSPDSYLGETTFEPYTADDTRSLSIAMSTPTPAVRGERGVKVQSRPWDARPLPPAPPPSDSVLREIMTTKKRTEQYKSHSVETSRHNDRIASHLRKASQAGRMTDKMESERRLVSAPIYSEYSTQWGRDSVPLPSIYEKPRDDARWGGEDNFRRASAPAGSKPLTAATDEYAGQEYLSQMTESIRVVTSPSAQPNIADIPAPLNIRKKPSVGSTVPHPPSKQPLSLRQQYINGEMMAPMPEESSITPQEKTQAAKKKSSWFKRNSKDKDDVFNSRNGSSSSWTDRLTLTETEVSARPLPPAKKKSGFNIAFWRNSRDEPQMKLSLADQDFEDSPSPDGGSGAKRSSRQRNEKRPSSGPRNIEPHQNWLARFFRVKPMTKCLCFSLSKRRARNELYRVLRGWTDSGIRDLEVDKERNIIFARVSKSNILRVKEVSFAIEIMTVIEHGKRNQLCIARFTQERGAASSFHQVVDYLHVMFSERNLLVSDKRKIKMMIKTLNS